MKRETLEGRDKPSYSQLDLLAFYKQYDSKKRNKTLVEEQTRSTGSTAEESRGDVVLIEEQTSPPVLAPKELVEGKSKSYDQLLSELHIAKQDLIEARQQFEDAKARFSALEGQLREVGEDLREELEDEFQNLCTYRWPDLSEKSENQNRSNLRSQEFLLSDEQNFSQFSLECSRK